MSTKYSEGINEHGISVLLASLVMYVDDNEFMLSKFLEANGSAYCSPAGKKLMNALSFSTTIEAAQSLIRDETTGHVLIFSKNECFCLEAFCEVSSNGSSERYEYNLKRVTEKDNHIVRSNHGVMLPHAGYQYDVSRLNRNSSEIRKKIVENKLAKATSVSYTHLTLPTIHLV